MHSRGTGLAVAFLALLIIVFLTALMLGKPIGWWIAIPILTLIYSFSLLCLAVLSVSVDLACQYQWNKWLKIMSEIRNFNGKSILEMDIDIALLASATAMLLLLAISMTII